MATKRLSAAEFVTRGYGQVEPNHLSAPFTGLIYAQLPADPSIEILENGMFAKYDYAHGVVTFGTSTVKGDAAAAGESKGEWMLVLNEIDLYKERESFEDWAMIKDNYNVRVYSPIAQHDSKINTVMNFAGEVNRLDTQDAYTTGVENFTYGKLMPDGSTMTPRLFGTQVGDIFTTNCIAEKPGTLVVGDILTPQAGTGYLAKKDASTADMQWQVVKVYTLADRQPAVKLQRIA